jgi:hypothetical protein
MEDPMFRRGILAVALAAGVLTATAVPAQAIPPGDNLIVIAYYSSPAKTTLVGQQWSGCGQPSGQWGTTSPYRNLFFTPC